LPQTRNSLSLSKKYNWETIGTKHGWVKIVCFIIQEYELWVDANANCGVETKGFNEQRENCTLA
jgi:hypothetical protein